MIGVTINNLEIPTWWKLRLLETQTTGNMTGNYDSGNCDSLTLYICQFPGKRGNYADRYNATYQPLNNSRVLSTGNNPEMNTKISKRKSPFSSYQFFKFTSLVCVRHPSRYKSISIPPVFRVRSAAFGRSACGQARFSYWNMCWLVLNHMCKEFIRQRR